MLSVQKHFQSAPLSGLGYYTLNGDTYTCAELNRLKMKAIQLGIKIPESLKGEIPLTLNSNFQKYPYTTYAQFYALDLPQGMKKTVHAYILEDLFPDKDKIVFSADMMVKNNLTLMEYTEPNRDYIYTHYIDYNGIRFLLNLTHLHGDFSLESNHIIIFLKERSGPQRPYQFLLSSTNMEIACDKRLKLHIQNKIQFTKIINSADEIDEMIREIFNVFCQKKRLIIAPETFINDMRLHWSRLATAEELFDLDVRSYSGIARFFADTLPNTILMYATSAYGLVERYQHIKSYKQVASRTYCGNAEFNKLTLLSSPQQKEWSKSIEVQISQVVEQQGIDEVYMYLYKGYMKHLNLDGKWHEPLHEHKPQEVQSELTRITNIVALMVYIDPQFIPLDEYNLSSV